MWSRESLLTWIQYVHGFDSFRSLKFTSMGCTVLLQHAVIYRLVSILTRCSSQKIGAHHCSSLIYPGFPKAVKQSLMFCVPMACRAGREQRPWCKQAEMEEDAPAPNYSPSIQCVSFSRSWESVSRKLPGPCCASGAWNAGWKWHGHFLPWKRRLLIARGQVKHSGKDEK